MLRISGASAFVPPIRRQLRVDGRPRPGYALEFRHDAHRIAVECVADKGGLITALRLDGRNLLLESSDPRQMAGSTFWPSPQSDWDWPPPAAFDREPCRVQIDRNEESICLYTPSDPTLKLRLEKRIRLDRRRAAIEVSYRMINTGNEPRAFAPWEISRVPVGGLTFYPEGEDHPRSGPFEALPVTHALGVTWFEHRPASTPGQHKLFADGSQGWIAHAREGCVWVKVFEDQPPEATAPGEAEIEIYATPTYAEVEQQGAYQLIAPRQSRSWTVTWLVRPLPQKMRAAPGSAALIEFVSDLL